MVAESKVPVLPSHMAILAPAVYRLLTPHCQLSEPPHGHIIPTPATCREHAAMSSIVSSVRAWTEEVVIPTNLPQEPDKNPMFLKKRIYQDSNGKVYPLPYTDRIADVKTDRT